MAMLSKKVLIPVLCVTLGACAFKKDDGPTEEQKKIADQVTKQLKDDQDASAIILRENNVKVTFEDSDPGYYNIVITWPEQVGTMEIFFNDELISQVSGKSFFKKTVDQNQKINLRLRAYANTSEGGRFLSQIPAEVRAPADYFIYSSQLLFEDLKINVHRVFIRTDGQLITDGHNVAINTDLIFIDAPQRRTGTPTEDSHIVTYKNAIKYPNRVSNIKITAQKAIGVLSIALIGLRGADGKDGIDVAKSNGLAILPKQAASGTKGADKIVQKGRSCVGSRNKDTCVEKAPICIQQPTNGSAGTDGLPGFDGTNGEDGGATGNLYVDIANQNEFALQVYQRAGHGGKGGHGSPGQIGGNGGAPGAGGEPCEYASAGPNGKNGADGKDGLNGATGQIGDVVTNGQRDLTVEP
jgi:hypothetical protein